MSNIGNTYKIFNYLLQNFETERNILIMQDVNELLKNYKSKLILYTYDSFLIDYCLDDNSKILEELNDIFTQDNFKVNIKCGVNFKNMKKVDVLS